MDFDINMRHEPGTGTVIAPHGDIDIYTCSILREAILDAFAQGDGPVVVSLKSVEFIDSTGLGVLVGGLKKAKASHRSFAVVCDQELTLKIFRITGIDKVLSIYPSLESMEGLARTA